MGSKEFLSEEETEDIKQRLLKGVLELSRSLPKPYVIENGRLKENANLINSVQYEKFKSLAIKNEGYGSVAAIKEKISENKPL